MSQWFFSYIVFMVAVPFLRIPFTIIWACMGAGGRNKPSTGIKALAFSWSSGQRQWKESQKIPILPKLKLNGNTISLIYNSEKFCVVSNSAKRDANGFFKVLWLSSHLLNSRHSVRTSKFGTCAVTGYCSFKLLNTHIYCDIYMIYTHYDIYPSVKLIECYAVLSRSHI